MFNTKRLLTPILFMLSIATTHAAEYKKGFFIKGEVGKIFAQKFKQTPGIAPVYIDGSVSNYALYGASIGYKFNTKLSTSLDIQFRQFKYSAIQGPQQAYQKINNYFVFLNGYYNIITATMFTPYLTVGAGYTYNQPGALQATQTLMSGNYNSPGQNTRAFAWNAGLGVKAKCNNTIDLELTYRYVGLGQIKVSSSTDDFGDQLDAASQNLKGHQITAGIVFNI